MNSLYGSKGFANAINQMPTGAKDSNATGYYKEKIPKGYKGGRLQQFSPEQIELFQSLFGHLGPESYLARLAGGDEEAFKEIEAPAYAAFSSQLGELGSRFSGMGMGGRKSSGFQNVGSQAASDFARDLAANRHGLQRQALEDLMGLSNTLLQQRPMERTLTEKPPSFFDRWLGLAANTMGAASRAPIAGA